MFSNFLKVAFRIFLRDRLHTLINIFGLAIGLTFGIIIFLYVHKEISFDRFHANAHRIYRVGIKGNVSDNRFNHAVSPAPLAGAMIREVTGVENATRVARFGAWLVRYGDVRNNEDNIIFCDTSFFSIFSFPLIRGDANEVLRQPNSLVISRSKALLYFGNEDPVGKLVRIENDSTYYRVTGVMEDIPSESHFHFDMVGSLATFDKLLIDDQWVVNYLYTYVLLRENSKASDLHDALSTLVSQYVLPSYRKFLNTDEQPYTGENDTYSFVLQPLVDIHLKSDLTAEFEPVGNILYVYLFTALALIILILSCINFISLATARSVYRAKEVIIRKIAGSEKSKLVPQFLLESSLLAFLAMALALFFTEIALPFFNVYMDLDLKLSQLLNSSGALLMALLIVIIGILSGLYPAMYLSSFKPVSVLRNNYDKGRGKSYFRMSLVVFQLFISLGVITMTFIVLSQYRYLVNKNLGFDKENLLVIRRPDGLKDSLESYKSQISRFPGVISVTNTTNIPGGGFSRRPFYLEGTPSVQNFTAVNMLVSHGFDATYRITLKTGRFFDQSQPADSFACVINETMARQLGGDSLLNHQLVQLDDKAEYRKAFRIIGIVRDFNFETLDNPVMPMVMILMPGNFEGYLTVRLQPGIPEPAIQYLKTKWEEHTTAYPFVYFFLDEDLRGRYHNVRETGRIFSLLSLVTILMACLGLFGLVSYAYNRRNFEIGIRKALGADTGSIIFYEIKEVVFLVIFASILAWTGVYFLVNTWMAEYTYTIRLNPLYFLIPLATVLVFSVSTIYYHTLLAANRNPGEILKYE